MDDTPIGARLRAWRKHKKFTLYQMADALGTTEGTLSSIETGKRGVREPTVRAYAKFLGLSMAEFYGELP